MNIINREEINTKSEIQLIYKFVSLSVFCVGPRSLLNNGYAGLFPRGKKAADVKGRVELYIYYTFGLGTRVGAVG
jgi:hypothetical protein